MPRNIEIKARVDGIEALHERVAPLADSGPIEILQDDSFFAGVQGRLKLRRFSATAGELIHYQRADTAGPKTSDYVIAPTASPDSLCEALTRALGSAGRVRKRRTLYLVGRTRVHLDRVEGLGDFVELEVVLADGESAEAGIGEAEVLMARLGLAGTERIAGAYVDLLPGPA